MPALRQIIYEQVEQMPVIDTHEHLPNHDQHCPDVLADYLVHYMSSDLRSAGLSEEDLARVRCSELPVEERWEIAAPLWEFCRCTGYGRALDLAVRGIYGIDGIRRETISQLAEAYKRRRTDHRRFVLRELCRVELAILDSWAIDEPYDQELFRYAWQPEPFIMGDQGMLCSIEERGMRVKSLDDWLEAFTSALEDALRHGMVALKNAMAYSRTLHYEKVGYAAARSLFDRTLASWRAAEPEAEPIILPKPVQDFLMHFILQEAADRGLVMQVHTGLLEGNGGILENSRPGLLNNLFLEYPAVKFDLFHMGYPYCGESAALAKMFPNVCLDLCWAHIVSPAAARAALADFLDAVPYNKIMGFGGDYAFVDGIYGHLLLARENISRVLADKVEQGVCSIDRALEIAWHLLYSNPKALFRLDGQA